MRSLRLVGLALVLLLALGAYLLVDGSGSTDTATDTATDPAARSSATAQAAAPSPSADDDLDASADAEPDPTDDADGVEDGSEDDSEWEVDTESGLPIIDIADLPKQARRTVELIDAGGPFPYEGKDGSTFRNDEGLLPDRESGYYAEYTVPTPGEDDRGARRIVVGAEGEMYWTADHYESFELIRR